MKKFTLLLFLSFILTIAISTSALADFIYPADTSSAPQQLVLTPAEISISYQGKPITFSHKPYYATGRLYVPIESFSTSIGASFQRQNKAFVLSNAPSKPKKAITYSAMVSSDSIKPIIYINSTPYVSFYIICRDLKLAPVFDSPNNKIDIYLDNSTKTMNEAELIKPSQSPTAAYLRLEDISANGLDKGGVFDDLGLEKLRAMSSYLNKRNQSFYIAWIPIYFNPKTNIYNDISKNYNLYNSSFIYTLDYMLDNGGHIGLHGLTHQYGNYVSADGYEFGSSSPFSDLQTAERLIWAKKIAYSLGYTPEFFEFPHYGATDNQLRIAEHYFDVVYQPYKGSNNLEIINNTLYVPTPVDYVANQYALNQTLDRINQTHAQRKPMSIFFHPQLDFERILICNTGDGGRQWHYTPYVILPSIVNEVILDGYTFSKLPH